MIDNYILYNDLPTLDLHGENQESASLLANEFINDNVMLKHNIIRIIHGKGSYILKRKIHSVLRNNKYVKDYKLDMYNNGATIVELYIKK